MENYEQSVDSYDDPAPEVFAFDSLASVRKRLLDLSGRNALLNFKHPKGACIRIIDELPDQIFDQLYAGAELVLQPVPEPTEEELVLAGHIKTDPLTSERKTNYPTAEQWAKQKNLSTSYDLPEKDAIKHGAQKHNDNNIQTLFYAHDLEARLRAIRAKAETALEESGANILFLAIGFLEWYETRESQTARYAPLFTIPIQLEKTQLDKKGGVYRYALKMKDDDFITNITLSEKLANDFGLSLPEIGENTPEAYFEEVQNTLLSHQPRWKIKRQISLVMLNFTKQAMYEDLDPANWPESKSLEKHSIIKQFFASNGVEADGSGLLYQSEHLIDDIQNVHERFPLIYDADSSQHSALIDAVNGDNLVIEGPPGSGKSQTITNLIAACISNGQKVLFVAEKMAALNVVQHRLERAGLGDFCLELHSHKTHKLKLLSELNQRLNNQQNYRFPKDIETDISRLDFHKEKLKSYVDLINSEWFETGLSIHQILNKAARYRDKYDVNPDDYFLENIRGENLTRGKQKELFDTAEILINVFDQVSAQAKDGNIANHYWYGVHNLELYGKEKELFIASLGNWNGQLKLLKQNWDQLVAEYKIRVITDTNVNDIFASIKTILALPELKGGELLDEIPYILAQSEEYASWLDEYDALHCAMNSLEGLIKKEALDKPRTLKAVDASIADVQSVGLADIETLESIAKDAERITSLQQKLDEIEKQFGSMRSNIPFELKRVFNSNMQGFKEFVKLVELIKILPAELWKHRDPVFDNADLDPLLEAVKQKLNSLTPIYKEISDQFNLKQVPNSEILRAQYSIFKNSGLFCWLSGKWWVSRKVFLSLAAQPKPNKQALFSCIPKLIEYVEGLEQIEKLNKEEPILESLYQGIDTPIDRIGMLRAWYRAVRREYGIGFGERVPLGSALLGLDRNLANAIADAAEHGLLQTVHAAIDAGYKLIDKYRDFAPLRDAEIDLAGQSSPFIKLEIIIKAILSNLQGIVISHTTTLAQLKSLAKALNDIQEKLERWKAEPLSSKFIPAKVTLSLEPGNASSKEMAALRNTFDIANKIKSNDALRAAFDQSLAPSSYEKLRSDGPRLKKLAEAVKDAMAPFVEKGKIKFVEWNEAPKGAIQALINRNEFAMENPLWLDAWVDYLRLREKLANQGLTNVIRKLEELSFQSANLKEIVQLALFHQLSKEIFSARADLAQFNGMEQMAVRERYQQYDRKLLELQREKIAFKASRAQAPFGINTGAVGNYTELSLIKHESGKKTRHIPLRSLLKRAGGAIQTLKPCFMMSPMSVAQYLEPGQFEFDIVIMDEASQIKPEDAIGAIARGKRLVVVGDPKQLPPTSFFSKALDLDDEEDTVALQESESILESVNPIFKTRRLRWHYRSRHESLIAFSNQHFYDTDLILFPSPMQNSRELGVRFIRVSKGRFVTRRNAEEAHEIAKAAANHMLSSPQESVGLVAMSADQRDEIERQLEQLVKDDPKLLEAFEKNKMSDEPLFIKNLENVQGDERDVIMISMTYGPEQIGGRTMQRFGPINADVGWRRLNVLFTRSKKRMHIFSSMGSGDIIVSNSSSRGVKSLRAFLEYCETGHLHNAQLTGKAPDSDFEVAVINALGAHGYQCEPQLGVAGYYLDIAVKDPLSPGRFLMGIECDGAAYHSAKSTRDRDRLRQDILESLGWNIRRIWSTDWFKNPQSQLGPILNELEVLTREANIYYNDSFEEELNNYNAIDHANTFVGSELDAVDLRKLLIDFDTAVIRKNNTDVAESKRLLRSDMLEFLCLIKPRSKGEYVEKVPNYLNAATSEQDMVYLEEVLQLIAENG